MNQKAYTIVMVAVSIVSSLIAIYQAIETYNLRKKIENLESKLNVRI